MPTDEDLNHFVQWTQTLANAHAQEWEIMASGDDCTVVPSFKGINDPIWHANSRVTLVDSAVDAQVEEIDVSSLQEDQL